MLLLLVTVFVIALYFYNRRTFGYWKKRGIKYEEPLVFFGTNKKVYLSQQSKTKYAEELYWKYPNEKVVGAFRSSTPELIIRDPELIKTILITDFPSFFRRGINTHKTVFEPLRRHLFMAEGDLWRMLRRRLTPTFTSGKLKAMFPLILERTEKLRGRSLTASAENHPLDARNLLACYTIDVIGACGFGIDADTLNQENSAFRQLGVQIFKIPLRDAIVGMLKDIFPELFKNFKNLSRIEESMFSLVDQIKKERNYKPSARHDFIDLLLEYQRQGPMETESLERANPDGTPVLVSMIMDDKLFAAQVFVFLAAGFETSSSSASFTLHQLAYNPEVQKKVQEDIDKVLAKYDNILSYDSLKEMTYLEWAFKEGMRMFPPLGFLMRRCSRKYTFEKLNFDVDEDVVITIPVQAMHMDPKYWDQPEEFRPERFHPGNFTQTQKSVYLAFGDGPRNCIGSRLGLLQSIAGLAAILSKFTVEPAPESKLNVTLDPKCHIVQGIKGTMPLMFRERKIC